MPANVQIHAVKDDSSKDIIALKTNPQTLALLTSSPAASTATNTKVSIGTGSTSVLSANTSRKSAVFVNDSDTVIYLSLSGTAVLNEGIRLNANGGVYEINAMNLYTGAVSAISSAASKNLAVMEN